MANFLSYFPRKNGLKFVTPKTSENFTTLSTARKEIYHLELAVGATSRTNMKQQHGVKRRSLPLPSLPAAAGKRDLCLQCCWYAPQPADKMSHHNYIHSSQKLSDPRKRNHKSLAIANRNFEVASFSCRNHNEIAVLRVFSESLLFFGVAIAVASDLRFEVAVIRVTKARNDCGIKSENIISYN